MPRVALATLADARPSAPLPEVAGCTETRAWFDRAGDPLHCHLHSMAPGGTVRVAAERDILLYVWEGELAAGSHAMPRRSSAVVERGAVLDLIAGEIGALLLTFGPQDSGSPQDSGTVAGGGKVHIADTRRVPRYAEPNGTRGGLHFNGECPTCPFWLHENTLPGVTDEAAPAIAARTVHAHSEHEIIFVTDGTIRLGTRLCGPGTALAIAAGTFYSFTPGPEGVSFINFRPLPPRAFRMKDGPDVDEAEYWRSRVGTPGFVTLDAAR